MSEDKLSQFYVSTEVDTTFIADSMESGIKYLKEHNLIGFIVEFMDSITYINQIKLVHPHFVSQLAPVLYKKMHDDDAGPSPLVFVDIVEKQSSSGIARSHTIRLTDRHENIGSEDCRFVKIPDILKFESIDDYLRSLKTVEELPNKPNAPEPQTIKAQPSKPKAEPREQCTEITAPTFGDLLKQKNF